MKYFVVRHGKTDANNLTRAAFGKAGAPLNELGRTQAGGLKSIFASLGIDTATPVGVSELTRAHETALVAGFTDIRTYAVLNEVTITDPEQVRAFVEDQTLPQAALDAAQAIIDNPPQEKVWVTHGPVIAAIQELLGRGADESFVPDYCEVREIEINHIELDK